MKQSLSIQSIFSTSFTLLRSNPILWVYFFSFTFVDLLIGRFAPSGLDRLLILLLNIIVIGLPGIKVDFLDTLFRGKKIAIAQTPQLLLKYFKKLFFVDLILIVLGGLFFVLSDLIISFIFTNPGAYLFYGYSVPSLVRLVIYLPLAILYFSLFHLFVVILVKENQGLKQTFIATKKFVVKNIKAVLLIVLLSLIIHYPVSELVMVLITRLPLQVDFFVIRSLMAFLNVLVDLYFFAVWMVLYIKKR